jgi:hypothetical protein
MKTLEPTNLHGIEFYTNKITNGSKPWHKFYNYPQWGVAASYFDYGVPHELGKVGTLTTYLDFTRGKKKNKWRMNIGTGIVYSTAKFDSATNKENTAISSTISYVMRATIHKEFQLNDRYFFNVNLAFRHYSNGKLNMPNNGMNYPIIGIGIRFSPKPQTIANVDSETPIIDKKIHFNVRSSMSWREVWQEDIKHKAYTLSLYASKQISKYNRFLLGVDGFKYDQKSVDNANTVYHQQANLSEEKILNNDTHQFALTFGTELLISKVSVIIQGGYYVYRPQAFYSSWYQRYGVKYNITKNMFTQVSLKAHSRTADLMEFGLGLSI